MDFWFTLLVCAACLSLSHEQSAGQDGSESDNKLGQLIFRQAQDLASMMADIKVLLMISTEQQKKMAEIETRMANVETELGNVKTEVTNNVQTTMANVEEQVTNVKAQVRDVQATVLLLGMGTGNTILQKCYQINILHDNEHKGTPITFLTEIGTDRPICREL